MDLKDCLNTVGHTVYVNNTYILYYQLKTEMLNEWQTTLKTSDERPSIKV